MSRRVMAVLVILSLLTFLGGCASRPAEEIKTLEKGPVIVASKIDTEGALLGQMINSMLRANGFKVVDKTEFGPTSIVRKALLNGEVDIYPEYTGNGAFMFEGTEPAWWQNAETGYQKVKQLDQDKNKVVWLKPAPANNTWAIAVRKDLAEQEKLVSLEDFANFVNRGGRVKLAGSEEFVNSPAALPAFQTAYGFKLNKSQMLTLSGGNTVQTEKAAAEGTDGVNFAMAYGTDGSLAALGLVVLQDTKGVQPFYLPAPIVRGEIYSRYPEISAILDPVFSSLDLQTLQKLNARIAIEGQPASLVAQEYLKGKGFLK